MGKMQPTMRIRFVRRSSLAVMDPFSGRVRQPLILQQLWTEQVVVTLGGDPDNQITEWREEWRDVPVEEE